MTFDNLINFYKDFEIFPDIISLTQIKFIFNFLSEMFVQENLNNNNINKSKCNFLRKIKFILFYHIYNLVTSYYDINDNKSFMNESKTTIMQHKQFLNYALFLESLFISAVTFKFNEKFTDIDKVLLLLLNNFLVFVFD